MDLKNALAVCLIALFSSSLVVLIARALDLQAASRLEPQLAAIVEELQAIRKQGGMATAGGAGVVPQEDPLIVYYFHGNYRCDTCQAIESQAHAVVESDFADELRRGALVWKVANYEQPAGKPLTDKFAIETPVVVLAKTRGGQIGDWTRLDEVMALVDDKPAFAAYVRGEIRKMLGTSGAAPAASSSPAVPPKAAPAVSDAKGSTAGAPLPVPVPSPASSLPVPK